VGGFLLYALEGDKGIEPHYKVHKIKQFLVFTSASFAEKQLFLVFWGN